MILDKIINVNYFPGIINQLINLFLVNYTYLMWVQMESNHFHGIFTCMIHVACQNAKHCDDLLTMNDRMLSETCLSVYLSIYLLNHLPFSGVPCIQLILYWFQHVSSINWCFGDETRLGTNLQLSSYNDNVRGPVQCKKLGRIEQLF